MLNTSRDLSRQLGSWSGRAGSGRKRVKGVKTINFYSILKISKRHCFQEIQLLCFPM